MKPHKLPSRCAWIIPLIIATLLAFATQLQPIFIRELGAVDGTFGLRPVSHRCAGLTLSGEAVAARFPSADWEGTIGVFRARYHVTREANGREYCLGQDLWFGE
ncbi:MAG: hypothetical protein HY867_06580 [Chloroflexi bacterium]|nr:hypothetical protein [Chloroflexota bacterium]